jgi:chromosome segregation ATPase
LSHPAEYHRRLSPRIVFFNADKQTQDHHARDLRGLQNHFRSVTTSRTQKSPLAGAHGIGVDDLTSIDLTPVVHDLREAICAKDKQIYNYRQTIHEAERSVGELTLIIREKNQDIRESHEKLSQAEHVIVEMMKQQLELNVRRECEISELTIAIDGLEQEITKQKADIAVLESQLQRPFTAPDRSFLKEINIPPDWTVDREALIQIVECSLFLFSKIGRASCRERVSS